MKLLVISTGSEAVCRLLGIITLMRETGVHLRWHGTPAATNLLVEKRLLTFAKGLGYDSSERPPRSMAGWHDRAWVLPCSANTLACVANGIAPTATHAALLGLGELELFPMMTMAMWNSPAVQKNCDLARSYGHRVIIGESMERPDGEGRTLGFNGDQILELLLRRGIDSSSG
jgi:phosphopantothenoylcysteine synthetase/decarboxylase